MKRFENILLAAGGESWETSALKKAASLAEANNARLTVVDVLEELPREMLKLAAPIYLGDLQRLAAAERHKQLDRLLATFLRRGGRASAKVLVGKPFLEIIREVLRNKHDLVIKAPQKESGLKRLAFGSTDMHLLRKCPCAVWITKPGDRVKTSGILAAVDPDPVSSKKSALNAKIMELGSSLARMEGGEFHVVHACKLAAARMLTARGGVSPSEVDTLERTVRAEHEVWLRKLVETYAPDTPPNRIHVLKGEAHVLIPQVAKRKHIDVIVMGTVSRTGIAGFFIGNTAERILNQIGCSVLAVKPEGFVTPVALP